MPTGTFEYQTPEERLATAPPVGLQPHDRIAFFHREARARMTRMARLTPTTALPPGAPWSWALRWVTRRRT